MKKKTVKTNTSMKKLEFEKYMIEHVKAHQLITDSLSQLHKKIDTISSVQVNGRQGLQESLQDIYILTKELRSKRNLKDAFEKWKESSTLAKLYSSKVGKAILLVFFTFTSLSVLHSLNLISTTPIQLISDVLKFIKDFVM